MIISSLNKDVNNAIVLSHFDYVDTVYNSASEIRSKFRNSRPEMPDWFLGLQHETVETLYQWSMLLKAAGWANQRRGQIRPRFSNETWVACVLWKLMQRWACIDEGPPSGPQTSSGPYSMDAHPCIKLMSQNTGNPCLIKIIQ